MCWLPKAQGQAVVLQWGEAFRFGLVWHCVGEPCSRVLLALLQGGQWGQQCCQLSRALGKSLHTSKSNVYSLETVNV